MSSTSFTIEEPKYILTADGMLRVEGHEYMDGMRMNAANLIKLSSVAPNGLTKFLCFHSVTKCGQDVHKYLINSPHLVSLANSGSALYMTSFDNMMVFSSLLYVALPRIHKEVVRVEIENICKDHGDFLLHMDEKNDMESGTVEWLATISRRLPDVLPGEDLGPKIEEVYFERYDVR